MTKTEFKRLGAFLKLKRTASGLSQAFVAKRLGYNGRQFISNFERGICCPPMHKLRILMSLYDIGFEEMTSFLLKLQAAYFEKVLAVPQRAPQKKKFRAVAMPIKTERVANAH